ncbi:MAG TPA: type VI secretion system baseplate subunit TssK [Stellaceae bacterium]|jgi:type VI secretion system protein ImpJ
MSWDSKIVWSEGMFLRTQHFQQQDRYVERLLRGRTENLRPHPWGLSKQAIDRSLLTTGRFALAEASGVFPDGTPFSIPDDADHPPPLEIPGNTHNAIVYLTLPIRQPGAREFSDKGPGGAITRYEASDYESSDAVSGSETRAQLRVGKLRLRYALEDDDRSGYLSIGLARIVEVRPDRSIQLDDDYISPCLNCECQAPLKGFSEELEGLLHARGEALAARLVQPGERGVADFADFVLLQVVNRYEPLLAHFTADSGQLHPETFYSRLLEIAGEIATFASRTKRATQFPPYRHDDLERSFAPVIADLRQLLSAVLEQTAVPIPLQQRPYGIRVAVIQDRDLIAFASFVLAARAQTQTPNLERTFPQHVKIGPVEQIAQLVNSALPGVPVRALPVVPRQLPYKASTFYFELDRTSPFWKELQRPGGTGGIAIHVGRELPEIELELWAIKG